jgi:hypothetical protein
MGKPVGPAVMPAGDNSVCASSRLRLGARARKAGNRLPGDSDNCCIPHLGRSADTGGDPRDGFAVSIA